MIRAELREREAGRAMVWELVWFWIAVALVTIDVLRLFAN